MNSNGARARRFGAVLTALSLTGAAILLSGGTANAAIIPTVPLATAANYSVLAGTTVTNGGPSVLNKSLGLSPGSSVTGFPPGTVLGVQDVANGAALTAKAALLQAYNNAAGRSVTATQPADLVGLTLVGGAYGTTANGPLSLTGSLTLDGENDPDSVWIFQTGSTLTFGGSSQINFVRGASACNVFWQVGSSATLISGAQFAGNILALTSISAGTQATIRGRLLARNGAVTLLNNQFSTPTCTGETPPTPVTTPTTTPGDTGGGGPGGTDTGGGTPTDTDTTGGPGTTGGGTATGLTNGAPPVSGPPRTGGAPLQSGDSFPWAAVLFLTALAGIGTSELVRTRRVQARNAALADATARTEH